MSSCIVGSLKCIYGGVQVSDISSTFLDKFRVPFQDVFLNSWKQDGKVICQVLGDLLINEEVSIPITIQWENGAEASGNISFLVLGTHEKILRAIFTRKNLHALEQDREDPDSSGKTDARQRLFTCSLDAFLDWSRKATQWNRKNNS
jgi:hypothetical protein